MNFDSLGELILASILDIESKIIPVRTKNPPHMVNNMDNIVAAKLVEVPDKYCLKKIKPKISPIIVIIKPGSVKNIAEVDADFIEYTRNKFVKKK